MRSSVMDLPVSFETPQGKGRQIDWGTMTVSHGDIFQTIDVTPLLKGLPDDRCQCPHWGYVLKGTLRFEIGDTEEIVSAGEVYYIPPGHTLIAEAGSEYVEFSPKDQMAETAAAVARNLSALS